MRKASRANSLRWPELVAYGCVGSATAFIIALTLGVFEQTDAPRDIASNATSYSSVSTP